MHDPPELVKVEISLNSVQTELPLQENTSGVLSRFCTSRKHRSTTDSILVAQMTWRHQAMISRKENGLVSLPYQYGFYLLSSELHNQVRGIWKLRLTLLVILSPILDLISF